MAPFPEYRPRRLRSSAVLRRLVSETQLSPHNLILPLFVRPGRKIRRPINAMPGVFQLSLDEALTGSRASVQRGRPGSAALRHSRR